MAQKINRFVPPTKSGGPVTSSPPVGKPDNSPVGNGDSDFKNAHRNSDVDFDPKSQHHTLGSGPQQAAPGNHTHKDFEGFDTRLDTLETTVAPFDGRLDSLEATDVTHEDQIGNLFDDQVAHALDLDNHKNTKYAHIPIGQVMLWSGPSSTLPPGFFPCTGTAVSRSDFSAYFALVGTGYGAGNGSTTFNIPNMTAPAGLLYPYYIVKVV